MSTTVPQRLALAAVLGVATVAAAAAQTRSNMRFAELDANRDGVITRREWNGSDQAFDQHDWNRDGILSGEEVRPAGRRPSTRDREISAPVDPYDDWTASGFAALDRNRDSRVSRDEWQSDLETFRRADTNRDGVLSRTEFLGEDAPPRQRPVASERRDRFENLDTNNDNRISRAEWRGTAERFDRLDTNRDAVLTRQELGGTSAPPRSAAWTQGHDKGLIEGREAGKADRRINTWDLEGQRELETADAGYEPRFGSRVDYQDGYREGFRRGYAEGYGPRQ